MSKIAAVPASPGATNGTQRQFVYIDLLKGCAAQLIVLHHLAFYGPMSDHVQAIAPELMDWLYAQARLAVQVFLVVGGFLAARSLSPHGAAGIAEPLGSIGRRYLKLAPPFLVATILTILASAWASVWMTHDSISPPPGFFQLLAHVFLLHGVLGYESISAGSWYIAIDFQLYTMWVCLLWLSARIGSEERWPWRMPVMVSICVGASLLYFNRNSVWDDWAPYFFGSYGLGMLAWWVTHYARRPGIVALLSMTMLLLGIFSLLVEFRSRIAVALMIACSLMLLGRARLPIPDLAQRVIGRMSAISYSVFLIHFPVCLVANAYFTRFVPPEPLLQALGMLLAWAASVAAGMAFHRWVELPLNRRFAVQRKPVGFAFQRESAQGSVKKTHSLHER